MSQVWPLCIQQKPAYQICSNKNCTKQPFICNSVCERQCQKLHFQCNKIKWKSLIFSINKKKIGNNPNFKYMISQIREFLADSQKAIEKEIHQFQNWTQNFGLTKKQQYFNQLCKEGKFSEINCKLIAELQKQFEHPIQCKIKNKKKMEEELNSTKQTFKQLIDDINNVYKIHIATYNLSLEEHKSKTNKDQLTKNSTSSKSKLFFSTLLKSQYILVNNNIAKMSKNEKKEAQIILIPLKNSQSFTLKIRKITWWISIGLCLKNIILSRNYQFKCFTNLGHGCYLIGNRYDSWSHHLQLENYKLNVQFAFDVNDVITVQINNNKLNFIKNYSSKYIFQLKLQEIKNDTYYGCVCFGDKEEGEIQLIQ